MSNDLREVKTWGWLGIIFGILVVIPAACLMFFVMAGVSYKMPPSWSQVDTIIFGVLGALILIASIQVLRLKELGRKIYLIGVIGIFIFSVYRSINGLVLLDVSNKLDWFAGLIIKLIFPVWVFYSFTRPKVKAQFKTERKRG